MKTFHIALSLVLIFLCFAFYSCSTTPKYNDVKVGMTYEEVEKLLGKPKSIDRGVNRIKFDVDDLSNKELYFVDPRIDTSKTTLKNDLTTLIAKRDLLQYSLDLMNKSSSYDSMRWVAKHAIEKTGQLIYVTWIYSESKIDTFHVIQRLLEHIHDTLPINHYYFEGNEVSERVYDHMAGEDNRKIVVERKVRIRNGSIYDNPNNRKYYGVQNNLSVIFDASSGRVVASGFYPYFIFDI